MQDPEEESKRSSKSQFTWEEESSTKKNDTVYQKSRNASAMQMKTDQASEFKVKRGNFLADGGQSEASDGSND